MKTRAMLNAEFSSKVKKLCPNAIDISFCGDSLVVTFLGEKFAIEAASVLSNVCNKVSVWDSLEEYADHAPRIDKKNTFKVWRVGGYI